MRGQSVAARDLPAAMRRAARSRGIPGALSVYYQGINPLVSPQPGPPFALPSPAVNRVESVSFLQPGRYLVICAVLPHFNDKMYAWVEVRPRGQGDSHP
jgi:hypothetical protein